MLLLILSVLLTVAWFANRIKEGKTVTPWDFLMSIWGWFCQGKNLSFMFFMSGLTQVGLTLDTNLGVVVFAACFLILKIKIEPLMQKWVPPHWSNGTLSLMCIVAILLFLLSHAQIQHIDDGTDDVTVHFETR